MSKMFLHLTATFVCFGLLSACVSTQPSVKKRYVWPLPPNDPRIEWIGTYSSNLDLRGDAPSWISRITGEDASTSLNSPLYLASDGDGKVFVGDLKFSSFVVFDFNKRDTYPLGGDQMSGAISRPTGVATDANGLVYAADAFSRKVHVVDKGNTPVKVLDLSPHLTNITSFAIDKKRGRLIIPDGKGNKIAVFDLAGKHLFSFGKLGDEPGEFNNPIAVAVDSSGNIVVSDSFNARIQRFTPDGTFINKFGKRGDGLGDFSLIKGIAVDSDDHIYVADSRKNCFMIFNGTGELLLSVGSTFALEQGRRVDIGGFLLPQGMYIDQNDRIYIVDMLNRRFQVFQYLNQRYLSANPITP